MRKLAFLAISLGLVLAFSSCVSHSGSKVYDVTASTGSGKEFVEKYQVKYICKEVDGLLNADFTRSDEGIYATAVKKTENGRIEFAPISSLGLSSWQNMGLGAYALTGNPLWITDADITEFQRKLSASSTDSAPGGTGKPVKVSPEFMRNLESLIEEIGDKNLHGFSPPSVLEQHKEMMLAYIVKYGIEPKFSWWDQYGLWVISIAGLVIVVLSFWSGDT